MTCECIRQNDVRIVVSAVALGSVSQNIKTSLCRPAGLYKDVFKVL